MVAVLQAVHRQLDESGQERYGQRWGPCLEGRPHQVCFRIPAQETEEHLLTIGSELTRLEAELVEREALPLL
jgi:hypothetical protein